MVAVEDDTPHVCFGLVSCKLNSNVPHDQIASLSFVNGLQTAS